jgi:hypothetical protein
MGGLHALITVAWTAVAASSRRSVPRLPQGPVVARAAALCWVASAAAGVALCPASLCAAAALRARARTKCR